MKDLYNNDDYPYEGYYSGEWRYMLNPEQLKIIFSGIRTIIDHERTKYTNPSKERDVPIKDD